VVPDSCFYIHHLGQAEDADLVGLAQIPGTAVHVLVPMIIVDELARLKRQSKQSEQSKQSARWRGYTAAVLDRVFKSTADLGDVPDLERRALHGRQRGHTGILNEQATSVRATRG
jgi:hypothetical protein